MNLSEFIEATLVEVMEGVAGAQQKWTATGNKGHINPVWGSYEKGVEGIREISFDVAVTVEEQTAKDAKGSIKIVSVFDAGVSGKETTSSSSVSRVSFSIPVSPPIIFIQVDHTPTQYGEDNSQY